MEHIELKDQLAKNDKSNGYPVIGKRYDMALENGLIQGEPDGDCRLNRAIAFLNFAYNKTDNVEYIEIHIDRLARLNHFRACMGFKPAGFDQLACGLLSSCFDMLVHNGVSSKNMAHFAWLVDIDYLKEHDLLHLRD